MRPLDGLREDPRNARRHPDRNVAEVRASLARYGQRKPIVVNRATGAVEAGNCTLAAARALGWESLAVVYVDDDPETATGYALADNRTAELAEWSGDVLAELLSELPDPTAAGFTADERDALCDLLAPADDPTCDPPDIVTPGVVDDENDDENAARRTWCPKCGFAWLPE